MQHGLALAVPFAIAYDGPMTDRLNIFLVTAPGLEPLLADEARELGFSDPRPVPGGVEITGDWADVRLANLRLRGAVRVLVRVVEFRAFHLAQLDKRARKVDWAGFLRPDVSVKVDVTTKRSKIYHAGAARQRLETAIRDALGVDIAEDADLVLKARIDDNLVTISVDTSGEPLHRRGHKEWVGKAPLRETMAALFLRAAGYSGAEPVVDPMCGSGTFLLEAAAMAAGLAPGRDRSFALDLLAVEAPAPEAIPPRPVDVAFLGSDRDDGAIRGATANAERAGLSDICQFRRAAVSDAAPPEGPPGLVMVNPPYGARIGNRRALFAVYGALGQVLSQKFRGWRVGLVTSDDGLAKATGLSLTQGPAVAHGGLKVKLWQAGPLG